MKTYKLFLSLLLCLTSAAVFSQKTDRQKPALFAAFPDMIQLSTNILQHTINASEGEEIIVAFSDDFRFKGTVISNIQKYQNMQCVMIKSPAYGNSIFQLTKTVNEDKTVSYFGRIINPEALDGYEIKKDMNNTYSFIKFATKQKLEDCSY